MKRILSVAVAALLMTGAANAQHANIGIKGGFNSFKFESDPEVDYKSRSNFHAGLLAHFHLAPQFGLQPEVVYSGQGAKANTGNAQTKLGYINVPVNLQYMFDNGFRIQAGPQVGFLVNAKSEVNNVEADIKDQLKTVDFGVTAGLSYVHVPSGFGVDARYNLGLTDITESSLNEVKNRGFQVGVFYLFKHRN
ncbi:MAG: PorT family protein [Chitinophagaceae bacterium]|nr:MAG: PorT family protein [Chitinophagaceae bacterium]